MTAGFPIIRGRLCDLISPPSQRLSTATAGFFVSYDSNGLLRRACFPERALPAELSHSSRLASFPSPTPTITPTRRPDCPRHHDPSRMPRPWPDLKRNMDRPPPQAQAPAQFSTQLGTTISAGCGSASWAAGPGPRRRPFPFRLLQYRRMRQAPTMSGFLPT